VAGVENRQEGRPGRARLTARSGRAQRLWSVASRLVFRRHPRLAGSQLPVGLLLGRVERRYGGHHRAVRAGVRRRSDPRSTRRDLLIGLCLEHIAYLETAISKLDSRVDALFAVNESEAGVPFVQAHYHLDTITGVGKRPLSASSPKSACTFDPLPERRSSCVVGWDGAGEQHHRGETPLRQDHQG